MEDKRYSVISYFDIKDPLNSTHYLTVSHLDKNILDNIFSILEKNDEPTDSRKIIVMNYKERLAFLIPIGKERSSKNYYKFGLGSFLREQGFIYSTCELDRTIPKLKMLD